MVFQKNLILSLYVLKYVFQIFFVAFLTFGFCPLSQKSHSIFFSGTPFRFWTFWTYIVVIKYELYQNLGPLRSILKALESKNQGGGADSASPCNVGLRLKTRVNFQKRRNSEDHPLFINSFPPGCKVGLIKQVDAKWIADTALPLYCKVYICKSMEECWNMSKVYAWYL